MSRQHVVAPSEFSSLRDLELLARSTVEGLRQGLHRSPFHGYSAEFSQYRHYRPGDELKYVDWKAFARTNRLYSRQFRETTNLGALFVIDVSGSMAFPAVDAAALKKAAVPITKFGLARATAAVLATLVIDQGDAAGLLAIADSSSAGTRYLPARSGRHHLHQFLAKLGQLEPAGRASAARALRRAGTVLRRRGLLIVLSDFYEEDETLAEMTRLSQMGHDVVAIHVVAQEEVTLAAYGAVEFEDLESNATVVTDGATVGADYERAFGDFLARIQRAAIREGLDYLRLLTGQPLEPALRRFVIARRSRAIA